MLVIQPGAPGTTYTVSGVRAVPPIVAVTTLGPRRHACDTRPVVTPFASVAVAGCVTFVHPVPVTARVAVAPMMGRPSVSLAVTVIVLEPDPAMIVSGLAMTVLCAALTGATVAVTTAVCVTDV